MVWLHKRRRAREQLGLHTLEKTCWKRPKIRRFFLLIAFLSDISYYPMTVIIIIMITMIACVVVLYMPMTCDTDMQLCL